VDPARGGHPVDSAMLAIMPTCALGIGNALGKNAGGSSLDNTIRFRRIVATSGSVRHPDPRRRCGFGHGSMRLFARDGELMATASQSMILRLRGETKEETRA